MRNKKVYRLPNWLANLIEELHDRTQLPRTLIIDLLFCSIKNKQHYYENKLLKMYKKEIEFYKELAKQDLAYNYMGMVIRLQEGRKKFKQNLPRLLDKDLPFTLRQRLLQLLKELKISETDNFLIMNRTVNKVIKE